MTALRLYILQRLTAALMVPMIVLHLVVIFYATRHGLSAADVLGRTRGSLWWALFYGAFVLAAAVHAAIGVRTVLIEWTPLKDRAPDLASVGVLVLLTALGFRAVAAVVLP